MSEEIPEEVKAYIAGFVDGDGCIGITKTKKQRSSSWLYVLTLSIANTDIRPLKFIQKYYGGFMAKQSHPLFKWKLARYLRFGTHDSYRVIKDIQGYLILKKERAEVAIKFMEIKLKHAQPMGIKCDDFFIEMQEQCKLEMNRLNKKGVDGNEAISNYDEAISELEKEEQRQLSLYI